MKASTPHRPTASGVSDRTGFAPPSDRTPGGDPSQDPRSPSTDASASVVESPETPRESGLDALAAAIRQDAGADPIGYILRSDTKHHGE